MIPTAPVVAGSLTITSPALGYTLGSMNWEKGTGKVTFDSAPAAAGDIVADYTGYDGTGTQAEVVGDAAVDLGVMAKDEVKQATFTLRCLAVGDAFIKVEPDGKDANTAEAIGADNLQPKSAVVIQKEAAVLEVTITAPAGSAPYGVGDEITVEATVKNTGASTAKDVALTLTIDAGAALAEGEGATQTVGYLAPGDDTVALPTTWTLVCTAAGKSTITVTPSGIDVLTGEAIPAGSLIDAEVTVLQAVAPHDILALSEGWNLISLPLIPTDPDIETVIADAGDITVNKVTYYTGGIEGIWQLYTPDFGDLTQMNAGKGYWVDVSVDLSSTFIAIGVDLALPGQAPPSYNIVEGWNLIGFTSTAPLTVEFYLGPTVIQTVEAMYKYDATGGAYMAITEGEDLTSGEGYWLAVNTAGKIYP